MVTHYKIKRDDDGNIGLYLIDINLLHFGITTNKN